MNDVSKDLCSHSVKQSKLVSAFYISLILDSQEISSILNPYKKLPQLKEINRSEININTAASLKRQSFKNLTPNTMKSYSTGLSIIAASNELLFWIWRHVFSYFEISTQICLISVDSRHYVSINLNQRYLCPVNLHNQRPSTTPTFTKTNAIHVTVNRQLSRIHLEHVCLVFAWPTKRRRNSHGFKWFNFFITWSVTLARGENCSF